jgi:hypothetical protein
MSAVTQSKIEEGDKLIEQFLEDLTKPSDDWKKSSTISNFRLVGPYMMKIKNKIYKFKRYIS